MIHYLCTTLNVSSFVIVWKVSEFYTVFLFKLYINIWAYLLSYVSTFLHEYEPYAPARSFWYKRIFIPTRCDGVMWYGWVAMNFKFVRQRVNYQRRLAKRYPLFVLLLKPCHIHLFGRDWANSTWGSTSWSISWSTSSCTHLGTECSPLYPAFRYKVQRELPLNNH